MSEAELIAYVFNCLDQHGEEAGRRILLQRLDTDPAFAKAAARYGLALERATAEAERSPKQ